MAFIPHWLSDNFRVKASLFLLAVMLWFLVVTERSYEYVLQVPLEIVDLKPGKVVAGPVPETVGVKFQATGKELLRMQFVNSPILRVNPAASEGRSRGKVRRIALRPDMVMIPGGIDAAALEIVGRDSLEVRLDDRMEAELPVVPRITVNIAAGYTAVGEPELSPPQVRVTGPKTAVSKLHSIRTEPFAIENARRNTEATLLLETPSSFGVTVSPDAVEALVKVERITERTLTGVPVTVKNRPRDRTILLEPGTVDARVRGATSILARLDPEAVNAFVDYRRVDVRRSNLLPVKTVPPPGVEVTKTVPGEVRVIVRRK